LYGSVFFHYQTGLAGFQDNLIARVDKPFFADTEHIFFANGVLPVFTYRNLFVLTDVLVAVFTNVNTFILTNGLVAVPADADTFILADALGAVFTDSYALVFSDVLGTIVTDARTFILADRFLTVVSNRVGLVILDDYVRSFCAWTNICSLSFLSSKRISLKPSSPLLELDLRVDIVLLPGRS